MSIFRENEVQLEFFLRSEVEKVFPKYCSFEIIFSHASA